MKNRGIKKSEVQGPFSLHFNGGLQSFIGVICIVSHVGFDIT
jgi:hypothetical protein